MKRWLLPLLTTLIAAPVSADPPRRKTTETKLDISPDDREAFVWIHEGTLRTAKRVTSKDGQFIIQDGKPGRKFDEIRALWGGKGTDVGPSDRGGQWFFVSPDGLRTAYAARAGYLPGFEWAMVTDGEPGEPFERVSPPTFSPGGSKLAYIGYKGGRQFVVLDGKVVAEHDRISTSNVDGWPLLVFGPSGMGLAYEVRAKDSKQSFDRVELVCAAPDGCVGGSRFAEQLFSRNWDRQTFWSADGTHSATVVRENKKQRLLFKGKQDRWHDQIYFPAVSPDGNRVAYSAREGKEWFVVVDGIEGPRGSAVWHPVFSPDSKRVAYRVARPEGNLVVVDGQQHHTRGFWAGEPAFSPDSRHVAYQRHNSDRNGGAWMYIDEQPGKRYDRIMSLANNRNSYVVFDGSNKVKYIAEKDGALYLVEETF